jgi:hypothetical protein
VRMSWRVQSEPGGLTPHSVAANAISSSVTVAARWPD